MQKFLRRIYDVMLGMAGHKHAVWALAGVSFAESSFFPIPPDIMLIPMCIKERGKAFFYATICTASSVIGGLLGYAIGYYFFETWGHEIIKFYGMADKFDALQAKYDTYGGWIIFLKGMTPIPYKILTILSGVMHLAIPVFIVSSICGRAVRFYLVAGLLWKFGAPIQIFIEKYLVWVTFLFLILLIGGFLALKYII